MTAKERSAAASLAAKARWKDRKEDEAGPDASRDRPQARRHLSGPQPDVLRPCEHDHQARQMVIACFGGADQEAPFGEIAAMKTLTRRQKPVLIRNPNGIRLLR